MKTQNIEEYFCYDCWQERQRREVIHGYNYKPAPIFYGEPHFVNWTNTTMYMGVELEIDKGGEYHDHAKAILDTVNATHEEHCYCKHDGSIYNGFEIVSHPATLEYHTNNIAWRELMQKALSMNYRSHDTDTCGLHIHISRNALGNTYDEQDNTIAKILYFVENNWYPIIKFTRRTENNLAHWANRYGVEKTEYPVQDTYDKAKSGYNRYKCINLQNSHTIEFRIFRGTLEHSTFIATLQFVNTLCSICKEISMDSVLYLDWYEFVSMIPETHTELIEYLKAKNLYALF